MSKLTDYTLEVFKTDRRTKEGRRLIEKIDFAQVTPDHIQVIAKNMRSTGFEVDVFETFVTRKNFMTGVEFSERYDRPRSCSPSSEAFWSM